MDGGSGGRGNQGGERGELQLQRWLGPGLCLPVKHTVLATGSGLLRGPWNSQRFSFMPDEGLPHSPPPACACIRGLNPAIMPGAPPMPAATIIGCPNIMPAGPPTGMPAGANAVGRNTGAPGAPGSPMLGTAPGVGTPAGPAARVLPLPPLPPEEAGCPPRVAAEAAAAAAAAACCLLCASAASMESASASPSSAATQVQRARQSGVQG